LVCPVKGAGVEDLNKLPRWLEHVHDLAISEQPTALIAKLQREAEPRRAPMMAPELPSDFVARPKEFNALKARPLDPKGDSIAGITAADGILWAELGEKPERLIATLSDLVTMLSGERLQVEIIHAAATKLAETLSDCRILIAIDDVSRRQDLEPFLQGGRHCVRLVTTAFCLKRLRVRNSTSPRGPSLSLDRLEAVTRASPSRCSHLPRLKFVTVRRTSSDKRPIGLPR
jgi:hypothetical protein